MLTTESLLQDSPRDSATILAALMVVGRHRTAIRAALSLLADFHGQFRDKGREDGAMAMADATQHLLVDRATIDRTATELAELGGAETAEWEATSRADVQKQMKTREAARDLMHLAGRYLSLAIRRANADRLEDAAAALGFEIAGGA